MARLEDNEVMQFTVYKQEPECLTYTVRVSAAYEPKQPEYLEQLSVIRGVLDAHMEKAEQANLQERVDQYRKVREQIREERNHADSGSR